MNCNTTKTMTPAAGANPRRITTLRSRAVGDRLLGLLRNFKSDTSGAVTVDFVVITAAIVSLGVMAGAAISTAAETSTEKTENCLAIVGKLAFKEHLTAKQKQRRIGRQCGRL